MPGGHIEMAVSGRPRQPDSVASGLRPHIGKWLKSTGGVSGSPNQSRNNMTDAKERPRKTTSDLHPPSLKTAEIIGWGLGQS